MERSLLFELYHPALPEVLSTETVKYDGMLFLTLLKCFFSLSRNISFKLIGDCMLVSESVRKFMQVQTSVCLLMHL